MNGKEIAHFDGVDVVDIRLTAAVIRSRRAELRAHPSVTLRRSSSADWLEVRLQTKQDEKLVVQLVAEAANRACSPSRDRSRTAGDGSPAGQDAALPLIDPVGSGPGPLRARRILQAMCRNITTLRGLEPQATSEEIEAAARQYVRKVSGVQSSSPKTDESFERAVQKVAEATAQLLDELPPRRQPPPTLPPLRRLTSRRS